MNRMDFVFRSIKCSIKNDCLSHRRIILVIFALLYYAAPLSAQSVHVFDAAPPALGATPITSINDDDQNQKILVIPVVSQDSGYDAANNGLNNYDPASPNLRMDFQGKFARMSDFWAENSYGRISFDTTVLERYYQLPRELDFYFNPAFVSPKLVGSSGLVANVAVPTGSLQLLLHVSDTDEVVVPVNFDVANSPYTFADLETTIATQLMTAVGDKLSGDIVGSRVEFTVGQRHVRTGSYVTVNYTLSDAAVVDALNLDTLEISLDPVVAIALGAAFPVNVAAAGSFTLRLENEAGVTEDFVWNLPVGVINSAADFVAAHGADNANAPVVEMGGELQFNVAPTIAGPIESMTFLSAGGVVLDDFGLDQTSETVGAVTHSKRNTVKGDRRLIMGHAIAAYMMTELDVAPAGPDDIPQLNITAANEAAIDAAFQNFIDSYRAFVVIFLDGAGKRAGASGGYIDIGIENGAYLYTHQTYGNIQLAFQTSNAQLFAHETGHNIGFSDLYDNSGGNYDPALEYPRTWDMMDAQARFSHTGAWHKQRRATWLSRDGANIDWFPRPAVPGVETRQYVLSPLEYGTGDYDNNLAGVGGRTLAKQINLPLGLGPSENEHYLIVQLRQPGDLFSQNLPQAVGAPNPGGVYITDTISNKTYEYFTISSRNYVHPLTDRAAVGGGISPVRDNNPAVDIDIGMTYPAYAGISVDIVGELPGPAGKPSSYLVDISREQSDFLDLRIEPWGAPPWQTTDIWVEHADGPLSAVPLPGNGEPVRWSPDYDPAANGGQPLNYVRVLVHNDGTVQADDVQVKLRINTPGGLGDSGAWSELPLSAPQSIPSGASQIFDFPWSPTVNAHTCLKAEVFRWTAPLGDLTPHNNGSQENVNAFFPTASSPWHAEPFQVSVSNTFDHDVDVEIVPVGLPNGMNLQLENKVPTVPARSTILVSGSLTLDPDIIHKPVPSGEGRLKPIPRMQIFHLQGYAIAGDYRAFIGGITYNVLPTVDIDIDIDIIVGADGRIMVTGTTTPPAGEQDMEIEVRYPSGKHVWIDVTTAPDGTFTKEITLEEQGNVRVAVNYPPGGIFAPTRTGSKHVNTEKPTPPADSIIHWCWWLVLILLILLIICFLRHRKLVAALKG